MQAFAKDEPVSIKGVDFIVIRSEDGTVLLENCNTGERINCGTKKLMAEYVYGDLKVAGAKLSIGSKPRKFSPARMDSLGAASRLETRRRLDYLIQLDNQEAFGTNRKNLEEAIRNIATARNDARPPHVSTIFRWRRKYLHSRQDVRALFALFDLQGGKGQSRLESEVEGIILECMEKHFLNTGRGSAEDVHDAVCRQVDIKNRLLPMQEHLTAPSIRTIQRRIQCLYAFEVAMARYGKKEAERRFAIQGSSRAVARILELIEIDHTPVDLLVAGEDGQAEGRPTLTVVLDRYSRCVLGYHLSLAGYGVPAVFAAIRHALMPKTYLDEKYADLKLEWPCCGWPEKILMDNGAEFHANAVSDAVLNLAIAIEFAKSRTPNDKPFVERFFRTFNYSFIHKLPGATLAKVHQRIGKDPEKECAITLDELDRMIHVWICSIYHQRPHAGLEGRTPLSVWNESAAAHPPVFKCDAEIVDIEFAEVTDSALQHYGIDLNTFVYQSPRLATLRGMLPQRPTVRVKWPRNNVGYVWIWDAIQGEYFQVANKDEQYNGMTLEQAKSVKRAKDESSSTLQLSIADAKAVLHEMTETAKSSKKLSARRRGARLRNRTSTQSRASEHEQSSTGVNPASAPSWAETAAENLEDVDIVIPPYLEEV